MNTDGDAAGSQNTYNILPRQKFKQAEAKAIIHEVMEEKLANASYHPENTSQLTRELADEVKNRLKELKLDRYKFVVQVVIGEQRGEGVKMACRCLWDSDTDNYAQDLFMNESLFCVVAVFGVFLY